MTVSELGYALSALINEKSMLALPGLGIFSVDAVEPQFIKNGCALTPPSSKILFSAQSYTEGSVASNTHSIKNGTSKSTAADNDMEASDCTVDAKNPVAEYYASQKGVDYENALEQLQTLCKELNVLLQAQAFITIPEFGTVRYGKGDDLVFEPCGTLLFNLNNWGLEIIGTSVSIKEQPQPVAIESQSQKPVMVEQLQPAATQSQTAATVAQSQQAGSQPRKLSAGEIAAIIAVAAIVLFVASMFIFKDTFMPMWEQLLYTPEELQYLRNNP